MNFLFPGFLWALFALSVPIIIHLFNFRKYKKVYFTNVRFLKELKQESESRSKLKQYLILISRLLALTALVFAFAQPYLPGSDTAKITGQKAVSVYIDNSFSMEAVSKNGYLLDVAKAKAREIVKSFSATDKFQVITNDFEGKHQRLVNRDEFLQMLDEIKLSPTHRKIHEVFMRQKDLLSQSGCSFQRSYLLSDFQRSFIDEKQLTADSQMVCSLIPLLEKNNSGNNVFI
ncbi:MAG: vWA domain-containing protein, partial [Bacteroidota bacterium]